MKNKIPTFCPFCGETAIWYAAEQVTLCDSFFCLDEHMGQIGSLRNELGILTPEQIEELQTNGALNDKRYRTVDIDPKL